MGRLYITNKEIGKIKKNKGGRYTVYAGEYFKEETVSIPENHKGKPAVAVKDDAFQGRTQIKFVTIPNGVTSIGSSAFRNCSELTSVAFTGTTAQWNAISKGTSWKSYLPFITVTCSNGKIIV